MWRRLLDLRVPVVLQSNLLGISKWVLQLNLQAGSSAEICKRLIRTMVVLQSIRLWWCCRAYVMMFSQWYGISSLSFTKPSSLIQKGCTLVALRCSCKSAHLDAHTRVLAGGTLAFHHIHSYFCSNTGRPLFAFVLHAP